MSWIIYSRAVINRAERLFVMKLDGLPGAELQLRVDCRLEYALRFGLAGLALLHESLEVGDFSRIETLDDVSVILAPRAKGGVLLCLFDRSGDGDLLRMVHLSRHARRRLIVGCEHARAAAGDRALFRSALEDAQILQDMVIV